MRKVRLNHGGAVACRLPAAVKCSFTTRSHV